MNRSILALALALGAIPVGALAQQNSVTPPAPTADQRQAMRQTFQRFAQQEEQLHQQLRSQILSALTPVHLRAVGATIGELAVAPNPDPQAAAKRLDEMLSSGERSRILAAHQAFAAQSRQLHAQMKSELQSEMPAGQPDWTNRGPHNDMMAQHWQSDPGTLLLTALAPHPMFGTGWPGHGMMPGEGPPPL
jgi:hypothetical protein